MNGILLVDKPSGWTSFDVVNKVRAVVERSNLAGDATSAQQQSSSGSSLPIQHNARSRKRYPVGHTGTLDPLATGLLVLLMGDYTKRAPELSKVEKVYEATMKLGYESTTGDEEGQKTFISDRVPYEEEIRVVFQNFTGEISQTPPAFSAVKVDGQRAYKLARQGKEVQIEPRLVTIHELDLKSYSYPIIDFTTRVSSGTYIRTLVEDIGGELGTGAYMTSLRRTQVGQFTIDKALSVEDLSAERIREYTFLLD